MNSWNGSEIQWWSCFDCFFFMVIHGFIPNWKVVSNSMSSVFSPWLHSCSPNWWLWPWHGLKSPRQKGLPFRSVGLCAKEVMQRPEMVEADHVSSLSSENWWVLNYLIHFETYAMRITEFMMVNIGIDGQWVCDQYVPAPEMMKWRTTWKRLKIRLKAVITYFIHHVLHSKICGVHWSSNIYIYIYIWYMYIIVYM